MRLDVEDVEALRPVLAAVVRETIQQCQAEQQRLGDRLAYSESEAAALIGVASHVLREARGRGEIAGTRIGKSVRYMRYELLAYLETQAER